MDKYELKAITEIDTEGKITVIASDESIDRAGDSLKVVDWNFKNFKKNPVLQAGHDYRPQFTIGIAKNIRIEDEKVLFEAEFHDITELARETHKMYQTGFLKAWSVGYIPANEEGGKNELLEVSAVAVPANANALVIAKGMNLDEEKEIGEKLDEFKKKTLEDEALEDVIEVPKEALEEGEKLTEEEKTEIEENAEEFEQIISITTPPPDEFEEEAEEEEPKETPEEEPKEETEVETKNISERWNKQLPEIFNKAYDINELPSTASSYDYKVYSDYLGCKVKNIYINSYLIPSPMLGTYLVALREKLAKYKLNDERNLSWNGGETPLMYELIKLTADKSDDFLIEGTQFYEKELDGDRFIIKYIPTWYGIVVDIISKTSDRKWNKEFLLGIHKYADENNLLKGQIFSLSGEFLDETSDSWSDLVLPKEVLEPVQKALSKLKKDGENAKSRGLMFVGKPGTGKTKTGKAMMGDEKDTSFIWVSAKDFHRIGPYTGIKLAFDLARKTAPTILFFEDIDNWIKDYGVDLLKTEMDGIKENKGMVIILTSNTPEQFPDALIDRPGRFHDVLDFPLPDKGLRKTMLLKWTDLDEKNEIVNTIVDKTEGYSGAHMKELVDYAEMIMEDDELKIGEALLKSLEKIIKQRELINELKKKEVIEKSPACRKEGESQKDCRARKIPEIIAENPDMDQEQAVAIAFSMCRKPCKKGVCDTEITPEILVEAKQLIDLWEVMGEIKEGRVISGKNAKIIGDAIGKTKDATVAMEKLLSLTNKPEDTPKGEGNRGIQNNSGRQPKVVQFRKGPSADEIAVRALQDIAKKTNIALSKTKNKK